MYNIYIYYFNLPLEATYGQIRAYDRKNWSFLHIRQYPAKWSEKNGHTVIQVYIYIYIYTILHISTNQPLKITPDLWQVSKSITACRVALDPLGLLLRGDSTSRSRGARWRRFETATAGNGRATYGAMEEGHHGTLIFSWFEMVLRWLTESFFFSW